MELIDRTELLKHQTVYYDYNGEKIGVVRVTDIVEAPEVKAPEPEKHYDEWCTDCKEYDRQRHCCPRWNRVIREALNDAEPVRKIGKWNIEISDDGHRATYRCSECGHRFKWLYDPMFPPVFNYCKNCGARMITEGK